MKEKALAFVLKTFGGLKLSYYLRHLVFGIAISSLLFIMYSKNPSGMPTSMIFLAIVNAVLYPYSRFVYEMVIDFIMGDNVFFINAIVMLITKLFTMIMCWGFAIFIAPIGLLYLFYYHNKQEKNSSSDKI